MIFVFIQFTTYTSYKVLVLPRLSSIMTSLRHKTNDVKAFPIVTDDLLETLLFSFVTTIWHCAPVLPKQVTCYRLLSLSKFLYTQIMKRQLISLLSSFFSFFCSFCLSFLLYLKQKGFPFFIIGCPVFFAIITYNIRYLFLLIVAVTTNHSAYV